MHYDIKTENRKMSDLVFYVLSGFELKDAHYDKSIHIYSERFVMLYLNKW